jgi:hypothetical protein
VNGAIEFPHGSIGRLYRHGDLPERLAAAHGAIIAIAARPRQPSLEMNLNCQSIIRFQSPSDPSGGWSTIEVGADSVRRGGACWLSFGCAADAMIYAKSYLRRSGITMASEHSQNLPALT